VLTPPPSHRLDEEGFFSVAPATGRGSHSGAAFRDSTRGFSTQNNIMLYEAS
jgi:hypothetical protein